jgi:hypothetical protein
MTKEEMIEKALTDNIDLPRDEYRELCEKADNTTAAHGVEGEAPLTEEERERRMRMNYYGSTLNVMMAILAALDDIADRITTMNNNLCALGGMTNEHCDASTEPSA